jgi:hypothetical protein
MMNNLMNNHGNKASNEAERQWWVIEFEFTALKPDGEMIWESDHASRDCPDCQRIQSQRSAQPQPHDVPKDTGNENG